MSLLVKVPFNELTLKKTRQAIIGKKMFLVYNIFPFCTSWLRVGVLTVTRVLEDESHSCVAVDASTRLILING